MGSKVLNQMDQSLLCARDRKGGGTGVFFDKGMNSDELSLAAECLWFSKEKALTAERDKIRPPHPKVGVPERLKLCGRRRGG